MAPSWSTRVKTDPLLNHMAEAPGMAFSWSARATGSSVGRVLVCGDRYSGGWMEGIWMDSLSICLKLSLRS
jgi:hypothetical protein